MNMRERSPPDPSSACRTTVQAGSLSVSTSLSKADVADGRLVLHPLHVLNSDDVVVARRRDEDVRAQEDVLDGRDPVASHCISDMPRSWMAVSALRGLVVLGKFCIR